MISLRNCLQAFCFNPCFNGFMDKERPDGTPIVPPDPVSILVLMDSWIKRLAKREDVETWIQVSILVLMDSWIKSPLFLMHVKLVLCFNPCFNGFMDKEDILSHNYVAAHWFQSLF